MSRGSYINSLVLNDIASARTEYTPSFVREKTLLVEALEARLRATGPSQELHF